MESHILTETSRRLYEKLYRDLGSDIIGFLRDKDISKIILNPDGKLWIDRSSKGLLCVDNLHKAQAFSILNSVAGIHGFVVSRHSPRLETELPCHQARQGERFTVQILPIASAPRFTNRKRSEIVFTLDDYLKINRMKTAQAADLISNVFLSVTNVIY